MLMKIMTTMIMVMLTAGVFSFLISNEMSMCFEYLYSVKFWTPHGKHWKWQADWIYQWYCRRWCCVGNGQKWSRTPLSWLRRLCWFGVPGRHLPRELRIVYPRVGNGFLDATRTLPLWWCDRHRLPRPPRPGGVFEMATSGRSLANQQHEMVCPSRDLFRLVSCCDDLATMLWSQIVYRWKTGIYTCQRRHIHRVGRGCRLLEFSFGQIWVLRKGVPWEIGWIAHMGYSNERWRCIGTI